MLNVTFFGVRGSTPCSGPEIRRYGGNTACVVLEVPGQAPIVLDLGTGLRSYGRTQPHDGSFQATALVSHLHWDHVQGLPFFGPVLVPGARLDIYGPPQADGRTVHDAMDVFFRPPYFPIRVTDLPSEIRVHDCPDGEFTVGEALVRHALIPHVGPTNGYRITWGGATVAYLPDHQQPLDGSHEVSEEALELCHGADLLIHDAQYTVVRVRPQDALGPLHLRVRPCRRPRGRRAPPRPVSPRPGTRRRLPRPHHVVHRPGGRAGRDRGVRGGRRSHRQPRRRPGSVRAARHERADRPATRGHHTDPPVGAEPAEP